MSEETIADPLLNTIAPIFPSNTLTPCSLASSTTSSNSPGNNTVVIVPNHTAAELNSLTHQQNSSPTANPTLSMSTAAPPSSQKKILLGIPSPSGGFTSIDITKNVNQAVQKGLIVSHESRCFTVNLDVNGRFLVLAKIEPYGPRVISATPLPPSERKCSESSKTDESKSNITPETLQAVIGPDTRDGKCSIVTEGNNKCVLLNMPNGESRHLTQSLAQQMQVLVRKKRTVPTSYVPQL
jgi:hypothetical protein